jgi:hypothetical protein
LSGWLGQMRAQGCALASAATAGLDGLDRSAARSAATARPEAGFERVAPAQRVLRGIEQTAVDVEREARRGVTELP